MKVICLLLLSLTSALAWYELEEGVVVLTNNNFERALQEFDYALIEFYAPWCGHCKRLAPEYAEAASHLAQTNPEIKLCKVDATVEEDAAGKYEIQGFPTLKFFVKGKSEPIDYSGGRTAPDIVNWLRKKTGSPTTEVHSNEEVQKYVSNNDAVALYIGSSSSTVYTNFVADALAFDEVTFINSNSEEVKGKYGGKDETIVVFANFGEESNIFTGPYSEDNVKSFIYNNRFPTVMPFNQNAAQRIFGEGLDSIFLIIAQNEVGTKAAEAFRSVAIELKEKSAISFSLAKIEEALGGKLAEYIGVEESDLPAVRIVQPSNNMRKFNLEGEITTENIKTFVDDFTHHRIKPFFRSEPIPEDSHDGDVRVVVGKNYNDVVLDETKDVLIEYYAPWCGHCQQLAPIYQSLAARLRHNKDLIIAKMDAVANEVETVHIEGFPTIKFYARNHKQHGVDYDGERDEDGFVNFLKEHVTVSFSADKPQEVPSSTSSEPSETHQTGEHYKNIEL